MSILNKLSDVLKEVFWMKTSKRRKVSTSKKALRKRKPIKKTAKKIVKEVVIKKPVRGLERPVKKLSVERVKTIKKAAVPKVPKPLKEPKLKKNVLDSSLVKVGEITHFFDRINVCVVKITQGTVLIGDKLTMAGLKTHFVQKVWSMQIESQDVKVAHKGQLIGLKVDKPVAVGDIVYK